MFPKDPWLKRKKFKYKEEENSGKTIAITKEGSANPIRKDQEQQNTAMVDKK